jgi:hypothetical protein
MDVTCRALVERALLGSIRSRLPYFHTNSATKQRQIPEHPSVIDFNGTHLMLHTSCMHPASTAFCHQPFLLVP